MTVNVVFDINRTEFVLPKRNQYFSLSFSHYAMYIIAIT